MFKFLEAKGGRPAVEDFWRYLGKIYLEPLKNLAEKKGLRGCYEYWGRVLSEEAADFTLELDEQKGIFKIIIRNCPSKGHLLELEHIQPYHDYCSHCDLLYRCVLEPLGFDYQVDFSDVDRANCVRTVRRAPKK